MTFSQEVEVNGAIEESIQSFNAIAPHEVVLNYTNTLPNPHHIHSNRLYLIRSLRELLINAKKFASESPIIFKVDLADTMIRFIIEDKGPGIPAEVQKQVFEPFYKMNIFSEGFGIGLGLTQQHVRDLRGTMTLDPDYKDGTRFIVEIPNA